MTNKLILKLETELSRHHTFPPEFIKCFTRFVLKFMQGFKSHFVNESLIDYSILDDELILTCHPCKL